MQLRLFSACVVAFIGLARYETTLQAESPASPIPSAAIEVLEPLRDDPDLLLWLDASESSTLTRDEQGYVSEWRSQGTRWPVVVTAAESHRPRWMADGGNRHPAIRFDGTDDVLRQLEFGQVARQWTLFLVARPRSNQGSGVPAGFHGFFSATRRDEPDFVTGINVDMGGQQTERFICMNVESAQGGGAYNLLYTGSDFGQIRVLAIRTAGASTHLFAESVPQASRAASDTEVSLHEMRIGARSYVKGSESGFLDGDIAELILYRRGLSDDEIQGISQYLMKKHDVASTTEVTRVYTLDQAYEALATYDWEASRAPLAVVDEAIRQGDVECRQHIETALISLLDREVSPAATAFACSRLVLIGSSRCVPVLEKLAADPQRYASAVDVLERLGLPEADQTLVRLLSEASSPASVALIQSLGRRRVTSAVDALLVKVTSGQADESLAAADALAELGDPRAVEPLTNANRMTPERTARYAWSLAQNQHLSAASELCERLWTSDDPHLRSAALRGIIHCDETRAAAWMNVALQGDEPVLCGAAGQLLLDTCREAMIKDVVHRLHELPVYTQTMLLGLRWTRRPEAGRILAQQAIESPTASVQIAGLRLLADVGLASDVELLVRCASRDTADPARQVAENSLCHLMAQGVEERLIAMLDDKSVESRVMIVRVLRDRRTKAAADSLARLATDENKAVRQQAVDALEQLGTAALVPKLIPRLLQAGSEDEQAALERTIWRCALRDASSADPAAPVLAEYERANTDERIRLLPLLGRLGGDRAMKILKIGRNDPHPAIRAAAVRGLANWPDANVAEELWQLAGEATTAEQRIWALRGYIRVVTLPGARQADETARLLEQAWAVTTRDAERRLILQRLPSAPCVRALTLAMGQLNAETLQNEAVAAAAQLAESLLASDREAALAAITSLLQRELDPALRTRLNRLAGQQQ